MTGPQQWAIGSQEMKKSSHSGPRPRVRPRMNTETRRHDERAAYHRRARYRQDPLDDELLKPEPEDGGVLSDYDEPPVEPDTKPKRRQGGRSR